MSRSASICNNATYVVPIILGESRATSCIRYMYKHCFRASALLGTNVQKRNN